jgi:hypothetical protein
MSSVTLLVDTGTGPRPIVLDDYLDAAREEQASLNAYAWIKEVRHARIDGQPLRRQFTVRGDSLWWFTELYLHKRQAILSIFRLIAALDRMLEQERPLEIRFNEGGHTARVVVAAFAKARGIRYHGPRTLPAIVGRLARLDLRARALTLAATASRLRPRTRASRPAPVTVAAFVHRAFWRQGSFEGDAESYIGPVLASIEQQVPRDAVAYVGVGPAANFGARRWWHALRSDARARTVVPVESYAPLASLKASRSTWKLRHSHRRMLWRSDDLRRHSVIAGCDCWPIVREELAGVAWLQWPWSVRAMDEAAAALDALRPTVALTYAEAGGWGRALVLEARRRRIPTAGLQHGFIYRHWLNYRHEPDEMQSDADQPGDTGFPRPTRTLLFDQYAARHLETAGRFPADALAVTGSPRLDALAATAAALGPGDRARVEHLTGMQPGDALVVVVTKFREAREVLPAFLAAAAAFPGVRVAIKTHPAETAEAYAEMTAGLTGVRTLAAAEPLAPLLMASRLIVTVNSTVALDAAVLGVPALVIGLPNNLSPFVEAGALGGAATTDEIETALGRILYDEEFRQQLDRKRIAFLTRFAMVADGRAAGRAAEAVLAMARPDELAAAHGE